MQHHDLSEKGKHRHYGKEVLCTYIERVRKREICILTIYIFWFSFCERYTLAAQDLLMRSRGVLKERGWRLPNDRLGSGDDITVFVIPLAGEELETWQSKSVILWQANQDTALIHASWGRGVIPKKSILISAEWNYVCIAPLPPTFQKNHLDSYLFLLRLGWHHH